jgi:hypothetical protein
MKRFVLVLLNVLLMMIIEIPLIYPQGAPMPFRIGGTVTIDGVQITQATDDGILIRVTKPDGTNYEDANGNAPEDKDGLNANNWYMIDIPIYKATVQPKGATSGETAAIHVYKNSQELRVTNPPNGQITIGGEGTSSQIDLTITTTTPESVSTPSTPTGSTSGTTGTTYTYSTGGASSNLGHPVEYRFDWGDGTYSNWSSSASASKSWSSAGNYGVKAQARCASDTSVISSWSGALTVTITSPFYDDFEKTNIDPNKWDSWEYVREIEDGKLVSKINAYGKQVNNALSFKNPNSINYIEADVVINEAKAEYDPNDSSIYSYAYACLTGYFYNDGTASGPGSLKGEVQVTIWMLQYRGQLFAEWRVSKAMDDGGTNWSAIGGAKFSNSIDLNTTYKLSILFEPSLKRFTFRVGTTTLTWTSPDTIHPSNNPWKAIGTLVGFSSSAGSFSGKISVTFDNVIAKDESGNVVMSDDFSFPIIDSDKWSDYEFVREVGDGKLWLDAVSVNQSIRNSLYLKNPDRVKDFQAKVTLFGFENFDGASTRARLGGHFYNDTGNPGSGYMGDVWAEVTLGGKDETPSAGWSVVRFDDQEGNASTILDTGTFPIFIDTDETYNLFLRWDGSKFTFKCDESVGSYTPTAVKYPPNYNYKELAIRISAPSPAVPSYSAYISAAFDDVLVSETTTPPPNQYALTISKSGTGSGTVTSSPAGINCGNDCSESYNKGTNVSLTATASSGSTFTNWSGACSGTGTCSVTMNSNKAVTATFTQQQQQQYTLTVAKSGTGSGTVTSSPAGINCGDDCSKTYTKVQKVKLTAKADTNSGFDGWSGGGCSGTKTCTATVDAAVTVTADFALKTPEISVDQTPIGFGSIKVGKKATKTLKIMNNGTGDLTVTIDGLGGTAFSISGSSSITIKSKKSYNLKVTFKPTSTGSKTAILEINSNDPDTPTLEIPLSGTGQ